MNYGEYHHSVNRFDRDNFEKIIRDSRRFPEVLWERGGRKNIRSLGFIESLFGLGVDKNKYEYRNKEYATKSKIRAVQSRNEFQNLSAMEEILLRFYGSFALYLNKAIRFVENKKTLFKSKRGIEKSKKYTKGLIDFFKINTYKDILLINIENMGIVLEIKKGIYSISLTNAIDQLINKHRSEHVDTDYFYRIAHAKRNRYMTPEEASKLPLNNRNIIKLGNIVMDKAITSVGDDLQSILYRYSHKGQNATHKENHKDFIKEEEILYVIKNNEKLNYMDIAGFKLDRAEINNRGRFERDPNNKLLKGKDELSSGELIIPSHTPFRVVGIQKMDRTMNRRVVLLEPMKLEDINQRDIVQNNFNGDLFSSKRRFKFFRKINFDSKDFTV